MIYTLKVSQSDLVLIGGALGRCAYDDVKGLIASLQRQVTEQEEAAKGDAVAHEAKGEG
jgi:hypothetical protein